jgi:NAD(P)-dependent dehydrogenase (short-subunit alcohol dehydrogenase family)
MYNLKDKICIVTGGASGIGLATVKAFAEKGAKVILSDFNEVNGQRETDALIAKGHDVAFFKADVAKENEVKALVDHALKHHGRLDVIVNNAGIGALQETHTLSYEEYHKIIAINQDGVFFGSKYGVAAMLKTGGGVVINTASILGVVGQAGAYAYNATKGAVNIMTKSLALEYAAHNIRCNSVNPGYIETALVNKAALGDFYDGLVAKHPVGRLGQPDEVAHGIVFLVENEFVTGHNLLVDGGYTAQ